jgi:signal transduction histidine kinase/CheY-like chemotaxis protein
MWYGLRISPKTDPDFVPSATELLQSTLRTLIFTTGGMGLVWYAVANSTSLWTTVPSVSLVLLVIAISSALTIWLLPRRLLAAQSIWLIGLTVAITLAIYLFHQSEIAFFYMLLPLVATVTMAWPAGILTEGLMIGLVWWLSQGRLMLSLPSSYSPIIIIGGAVSGMLGWAATRTLLTVTQWSSFSFEQARVKMEQARDQRMEFKQTQEDLILANRELARLSDRLKAMHQVAEDARRTKEEFVANVSHELRTPLNMIIGFSEMITQSPQIYGVRLPPALLADITAIQRNSQHLARLVDDVLDLSQIEAGRMALIKEWTTLQEIVDEAALAVRALYESKGLYLETECSPDLPPVFCDSTRIRQVVLNLLSNAGRFTEQGGVRIKAWCEKDDVMVSVTDTGPGITLENQERLFEPFYQIDGSIRRRHGGSGLGLSISKRFVEMHGGKMWLESPSPSLEAQAPKAEGLRTDEEGIGTTFRFSLPLDTSLSAVRASDGAKRWFSPYDEYEYKVRTRRSKAPAPTMVPRFVLLEEGETLQRLFNRYLDDTEIVSVRDVEQATRELNRTPARALLVNASPFAEATGQFSFSKDQLADLPYGIPAVMCWVPGLDDAAKQLGVVRYLVKPVTREMLLSTLEELGEDVRSVLLVDDEPEVLQLFARMLTLAERGYRVLQATSGRRALSLLRERQPNVMLLDLIMPGMDGFHVLQEKSKDASIREIPVIVISATDPTGEPIVSDTLTVTRGGGLSMRDLMTCIQAVSEVLSPSARPDDRGRSAKPVV